MKRVEHHYQPKNKFRNKLDLRRVWEVIKKEQITENQLEDAIRESGFESISEISIAKLEIDGNSER